MFSCSSLASSSRGARRRPFAVGSFLVSRAYAGWEPLNSLFHEPLGIAGTSLGVLWEPLPRALKTTGLAAHHSQVACSMEFPA